MKDIVLIVGAVATPFFLAVVIVEVQRRARQRAHQNFLRTAPADDLVAHLKVSLTGWSRFPTSSAMLAYAGTWTDCTLLESLEALFGEISEEDRTHDRRGRDSNFFDFYDLGFASVCENLRTRMGIHQPWDRG